MSGCNSRKLCLFDVDTHAQREREREKERERKREVKREKDKQAINIAAGV